MMTPAPDSNFAAIGKNCIGLPHQRAMLAADRFRRALRRRITPAFTDAPSRTSVNVDGSGTAVSSVTVATGALSVGLWANVWIDAVPFGFKSIVATLPLGSVVSSGVNPSAA